MADKRQAVTLKGEEGAKEESHGAQRSLQGRPEREEVTEGPAEGGPARLRGVGVEE